jgi:hypothetical protein
MVDTWEMLKRRVAGLSLPFMSRRLGSSNVSSQYTQSTRRLIFVVIHLGLFLARCSLSILKS